MCIANKSNENNANFRFFTTSHQAAGSRNKSCMQHATESSLPTDMVVHVTKPRNKQVMIQDFWLEYE